MKNLIKHELFKLVRSKSFIITLAITLGMVLLFNVLAVADYVIANSVDAPAGIYVADSVSNFATLSSMWSILIAVIVSAMIVSDQKLGITRNIIMSGYDRYKIYLVKYLVIVGLFFAIFIATLILFSIAPLILAGFSADHHDIGVFVGSIFKVLLVLAGVVAFVMFIGSITKSTAATIGITIGASVFVTLLASMIGFMIPFDTAEASWKLTTIINSLYVGNLYTIAGYTMKASDLENVLVIVVPSVTIVITMLLGIYLFGKRNFK